MTILPRFPSALIIVALLGSAATLAKDTPSKDCASDNRAAYVCDVENVEDLVHIRNTPWILAGRLSSPPTNGGFYLVDSRDAAVTNAVPDFSGAKATLYAACPGAPARDAFAAHGIGIRYGNAHVHEVYAVNHGGRESVEIFDLDVGGAVPKLTWKGCVVVPAAVSPNSVTPLPDGGLAVTSFGIRTDPKTYEKAMTGGVSGFVAQWTSQGGWSEVPGTQLSATNGIAVSKDGKQLFVTGWGDRKLHVFSRGEIPYTHRAVDLGEFHPDNISTAADGKLLIAGQAATPSEIFACTEKPVCDIGFKVIRVDPVSLAIESLLDEPGSAVFGGASAAILVGKELWVGTFSGNRIARYRLPR